MFFEERYSAFDFMSPVNLPTEGSPKLELIPFIEETLKLFQDPDKRPLLYDSDSRLSILIHPLCEEKNFEAYPSGEYDSVEEPLSQIFDTDKNTETSSNDNNLNSAETAEPETDDIGETTPWDEVEQEEEELDDEPSTKANTVTPEQIQEVKERIENGEVELRADYIRLLALYVAEKYEELGPEYSRKFLAEIKEICRTLLEEGETEHQLMYGRLLNESAFIEYLYPENGIVAMNASREAVAFLTNFCSSNDDYDSRAEALEQLYAALRLQAESYERNGAINSALASRIEEEKQRKANLNTEDLEQRQELASIAVAIGNNLSALGDQQSSLERFQDAYELLCAILADGGNVLPDVINTKYRIAMAFHALGQNENALPVFEELNSLEQKFIDGQDESQFRIYANHLQIQCDFFAWTNSYEKMAQVSMDLIRLYEKMAEQEAHPGSDMLYYYLLSLCDAYRSLGYAYQSLGDYANSHLALQKSLEYTWAAYKENDIDVRPYLTDLGTRVNSLLCAEDRTAEVLPIVKLLVSLMEQLLEERSERSLSLYPRLLHHLAHLQGQLGEEDDALLALDKGIRYWKALVFDEGCLAWREAYAASLGERGSFYMKKKNEYEKARQDFSRAVATLKELVEDDLQYDSLPMYGRAVIDLAQALTELKKPDEAAPIVQELLDFWSQLYFDKKIDQYFDIYYELIYAQMQIVLSTHGIEEASAKNEAFIEQTKKITEIFLSDPQYNRPDIREILEKLSFTIQLMRMGFLEYLQNTEQFCSELIALLPGISLLLLRGESQYVEKVVLLLKKPFDIKDQPELIIKLKIFLTQLTSDLIQALQEQKIEYSLEYTPLFNLLLLYITHNSEFSPEELCSAVRQKETFAKLGMEEDEPDLAHALWISVHEELVRIFFDLQDKEEVEKLIGETISSCEKIEFGEYLETASSFASFNAYIGSLREKENQPEEAKNFYLKAVELFQITEDRKENNEMETCYPDTCQSLGDLYRDNNPILSFEYYERAVELYRKINPPSKVRSSLYLMIASILVKMAQMSPKDEDLLPSDPDKVLGYLRQAEELFDSSDYTYRENYTDLLFLIWNFEQYFYAKLKRYRDLDDLSIRITVWEIAIPENMSWEQFVQLCLLKLALASYYHQEGLINRANSLLSESLRSYYEAMGKQKKKISEGIFPLVAAGLILQGQLEMRQFKEALINLKVMLRKFKTLFRSFRFYYYQNPQNMAESFSAYLSNYIELLLIGSSVMIENKGYRRAIRYLNQATSLWNKFKSLIDPVDLPDAAFESLWATIAIRRNDYKTALLHSKAAMISLSGWTGESVSLTMRCMAIHCTALWKNHQNLEALGECEKGILFAQSLLASGSKCAHFHLAKLLSLKGNILLEESATMEANGLFDQVRELVRKGKELGIFSQYDLLSEIPPQ